MTGADEKDTASVPSLNDLVDALAGRCQVSVLLVDPAPAVKLCSTPFSGKGVASIPASHDWTNLRIADGQKVTLKRGEYELPLVAGEHQSAVVLRLTEMAGINAPKGLGMGGVLVARDGVIYRLQVNRPGSHSIEGERVSALGLPETATLLVRRVEVESHPESRIGFCESIAPIDQGHHVDGGVTPIAKNEPPRDDRPSFVHTTKVRRDSLMPAIEKAQTHCRDPLDTAEVWAQLLVLAEKRFPPLIGATEEGLQYFKDGEAKFFARDALRKRLGRLPPISADKRR